MRWLSGGLFVLCFAVTAHAEWMNARSAVHVGPWPSSTDPVVQHLERGDPVEILERQQGWGRITPYTPPKAEGLKGRRKVARWVKLRHVTDEQPIALPKPACDHPDIAPDALPKAGPGALSDDEAATLCRGAKQLLATDRCKRVVYGDKSLSKPGSFFINCGGANLFFTASDLAPEE